MKEKAIHKRIGKKVLGYHRHFTKYLYERDTIFATLWVFLFIVVLGSIPINFYILNPLKLALKDFDFNDVTYAELHKNENIAVDSNIVIVNIGHADREVLSMIIDKLGSMKPKVMGLDAYFEGPGDPYQDSLLNASFARNTNLVVAVKLVPHGDKGDTLTLTGNYFKSASQYGNVNFFIDNLASFRTFYPVIKDHADKEYPFFSTVIVGMYDSTSYKRLMKKGDGKMLINYARRTNKYFVVRDYEQLLQGGVEDSLIRDKIVLLGYVNENPDDIEDKKFTPMNERFFGKSIPDMNGIVVHANIISMVLDNNYIKKLPSWVNWLVAILICWLHMSFFIRYYLENHIWFHLVAKIAQLASAFIFTYLGVIMFDRYNIKLDMKMSLIVIVMAVDVIYFYEAFAVWLHKKYNYKTVFHQKHH